MYTEEGLARARDKCLVWRAASRVLLVLGLSMVGLSWAGIRLEPLLVACLVGEHLCCRQVHRLNRRANEIQMHLEMEQVKALLTKRSSRPPSLN